MRSRSLSVTLTLALAAPWLGGCGGGWRGPSGPAFASNGERIYLTATDEQGQRLTYTGGPAFGGLGKGMRNTWLACADCHLADGRGGAHRMHMWVMNAPDIRWAALAAEEEHAAGPAGDDEQGDAHAGYDLETFRLAVVDGKHAGGQRLSSDMPRWNLGDDDLADLAGYLKSLP